MILIIEIQFTEEKKIVFIIMAKAILISQAVYPSLLERLGGLRNFHTPRPRNRRLKFRLLLRLAAVARITSTFNRAVTFLPVHSELGKLLDYSVTLYSFNLSSDYVVVLRFQNGQLLFFCKRFRRCYWIISLIISCVLMELLFHNTK